MIDHEIEMVRESEPQIKCLTDSTMQKWKNYVVKWKHRLRKARSCLVQALMVRP